MADEVSPFARLMGEMFKGDLEKARAAQFAAKEVMAGNIELTDSNGNNVGWSRTVRRTERERLEYEIALVKKIAADPELLAKAVEDWKAQELKTLHTVLDHFSGADNLAKPSSANLTRYKAPSTALAQR